MPSFRPLTNDEALTAIDFSPPEIKSEDLQRNFDILKSGSQEFRLSELVQTQSRLRDVRSKEHQKDLEAQVLERVGAIQEEAYQKAYTLGFHEGEEKIWRQKSEEIEPFIQKLGEQLDAFTKIKSELVTQNEKYLMELVFAIAKRVIASEVQFNPEFVVSMLKEAATKAQPNDKLELLIAKDQMDFFESFIKSTKREHDFLKAMNVSPSDQLSQGSFILKTSYGEFDGRIEEKVAKLWSEVAALLPEHKEELKSVS